MFKRLKTVFKNSFKKHSKQCWIWKGRFLELDQLQNRCNEEKRKEKKKERGEGKEEKRKKAMVAVADPGEGPLPPPPPPPPIFRPNLGPKDQKKIAIRSIILSLTSLLESVYEIRRVARTLVLQSGDTQLMFKIKLCFQPNLGVQ